MWRLIVFIGLEVANAQAPAAFDRLGDGNCMTSAMLPVRGRSRRDMEHGECRGVCDTDNCIGYSYAPCERICTLHGEPELFRGLPLPERWSTLNGGGLIAKTDEKCGTSCYVRKAPCPGGTLRSAGAFMNYDSLTYGLMRTLDCPFPHKGSVTILCTSTGINVESGRCLRPCDEGFVRDDFFEVKYPPTRHGEYGYGNCTGDTLGNMTIYCSDGAATWVLGQCGINCPAGSLRSGSAVIFFPVLLHEERHTMECPSGWIGNVGLECINEDTSLISGGCKKHCSAGLVNVSVASPPSTAISGYLTHQALEHGKGIRTECLNDDDMLQGSLILFCNDGNVTPDYDLSDGPCKRHCAPGYIGEGMRGVSYGKILHGQNQTLQCNAGYDGFFLINCNDGQVRHLEGHCYMDCVAGTITSNTITLPHIAMKHRENTTVECPIETHRGNITVLCDDGKARMIEGFCGENCTGGEIRSNDALVRYPGIPHGFRENISCPAPWGTSVLVVNLIRQPRIPGVDNVSEVGSGYNFTEDDRFILCGCCLPPPPLPEVAPLEGLDAWVVIYWAAAVGGAGFLIAFAAGYWIHHKHKNKKISKVTPEPKMDHMVLPEDQLALPDDDYGNNHQLAIKEPAASESLRDARHDVGRMASATPPASMAPSASGTKNTPMPQMLKPRREGTNKDWQYW